MAGKKHVPHLMCDVLVVCCCCGCWLRILLSSWLPSAPRYNQKKTTPSECMSCKRHLIGACIMYDCRKYHKHPMPRAECKSISCRHPSACIASQLFFNYYKLHRLASSICCFFPFRFTVSAFLFLHLFLVCRLPRLALIIACGTKIISLFFGRACPFPHHP